MDDIKEFIDETKAGALAKAALHYSVSEDELDARTLPDDLEVSGLGGRVLVLASVKSAPLKAGPTSEFVRDLLGQLPLQGAVEVSESGRGDRISVRVQGGGFADLANEHEGLADAVAHLAERVAERRAGSDARVDLDVPGFRARRDEDGRGGRGRGDRRDGRRDRGDRGDSRERGSRDRGGRGGRDRGGRGGERRDSRGGGGGRGRDRDRRPRDDGDSPSNPELERAARDAGERVRESGEPHTLEPMNSRDRWIVHNALKEVSGVSSESVGEGRTKQVKIVPA